MPERVVYEELICQTCGLSKVYAVRMTASGWPETRLNIDRSECKCGYNSDEAALCAAVVTGNDQPDVMTKIDNAASALLKKGWPGTPKPA